jgi:hypothetical protein
MQRLLLREQTQKKGSRQPDNAMPDRMKGRESVLINRCQVLQTLTGYCRKVHLHRPLGRE